MNASQNTALLARGIADALDNGESAHEIAAQLGMTTTEVLNRADNYRARGLAGITGNDADKFTADSGKIEKAAKYQCDSPILQNGFNFELVRAGRSWLKLRDRVLKARPGTENDGKGIQPLIDEAKKARARFVSLVPYAHADFSEIVAEHCGMGRDWAANGKMVKEFADANGVDQALAADLVGRKMAVAQDYAQATRSLNFGRYLAWLEDAANEASNDVIPDNLEEIITQAYNRAAQWNQPADGLLIRDFAENMGVSEILPTWAECLKANMPTAEQALEARKRIANRAAAMASAEQEAEQELTQIYGDF